MSAVEEKPTGATQAPSTGAGGMAVEKADYMRERAEAAMATARRKLVSEGEHVATFKVLQRALLLLKIESLSQLGLDMADLPFLNQLLLLEGRVRAFIECFLHSRLMTTIHDLDNAISKNEGVNKFEELRLGPLLRHPLVAEFFSIPLDMTEVLEITMEDVIFGLDHYIKFCRGRRVTEDGFMEYMVQRMSAPCKAALGIYLKGLGYYIGSLKAARRAEQSDIERCIGFIYPHNQRNLGVRSNCHQSFLNSNYTTRSSCMNEKIIEGYESLAHITFDSSSESTSEKSEAVDGALNVAAHHSLQTPYVSHDGIEASGMANMRARFEHLSYADKQEMDSRSVYVSNVWCSPHEIQLYFERCGFVNRVTLSTDCNGNPRGFAYVEYANKQCVEKAIKWLNGTRLHRSKIGVAHKRTNIPQI